MTRRLHLIIPVLTVLILLVAVMPAARSQEEKPEAPYATINPADITARVTDEGVAVDFLVERLRPGKRIETVDLKLLDAEYETIGEARKKVFLRRDGSEQSMLIPAKVSESDLPMHALAFDISGQTFFKRFPRSRQDMTIDIVGQKEWIAGSRAALRVACTQGPRRRGLGDVRITFALAGDDNHPEVSLYEGVTAETGTSDASFSVPYNAAGSRKLIVTLSRGSDTYTIEQNVEITSAIKVLLTSDKPYYQPRETMHLRTLALHRADLTPAADQPLTIEVSDAKGNKVFKVEDKTSKFGIAAADFQLADEVNEGQYTLKAILGELVTEKTVTVKQYVLPKFKMTVNTEKPYYLPGQDATGTVNAKYMFGKPISGGDVKIAASAYDFEMHEFETVEGKTDKDGNYEFKVHVPEHLVGQPLFKGNTQITLKVTVKDTADHSEEKWHDFTVARDPVHIEIIPESGNLVAGVQNEVFVVTSYPSNKPAKVNYHIWVNDKERPNERSTSDLGNDSFIVNPKGDEPVKIRLAASDEDGNSTTAERTFEFTQATYSLLLRTGSGVYKVGDTVPLEIVASGLNDEPVFVDIVKDRQTVLTKTCKITDGMGKLELPLDVGLWGQLQISAYKIMPNSEFVRDTKEIFVSRADDLNVEFDTNKEQYRPGDPALLTFKVRDRVGKGAPTALGIDVVDEAVYAMSENQPGLLQTYFTLEKELLEPAIEIHGFDVQTLAREFLPTPEILNLSRISLAPLGDDPKADLRYNSNDEWRNDAVQELGELAQMLMSNGVSVGSGTRDVESLMWQQGVEPGMDLALDPWGQPYQVAFVATDENSPKYRLFSVGADNDPGTADDVTFDGRMLVARSNWGRGFIANGDNLDLGEVAQNEWFFGYPAEGRARYGGLGVKKGDAILGEDGERIEALGGFKESVDVFLYSGNGAMEGPNYFVEPVRRYNGVDVNGRASRAVAAPVNAAGLERMRAVGYMGGGDRPRAAEVPDFRAVFGLPAADVKDLDAWVIDFDDRDFIENEGLILLPDGSVSLTLDAVGSVNASSLDFIIADAEGTVPTVASGFKATNAIGEAPDLGSVPEDEGAPSKSDEVRIRSWFPETLFTRPQQITDDDGNLRIALASVADSITTWRMTAQANTLEGNIGSATGSISVFQDFFVDLDLPLSLTQDDEVTIPVAVHNYLKEPQDVRVVLQKEDWFDLVDGEGYERQVHLGAEEVTSVKYRVRAREIGNGAFTVFGYGSDKDDAMSKTVEVIPNGKEIMVAKSDRLDGILETEVEIPEMAIDGASRLFVKVYPGMFSQVLEGLDGVMRMPNGCFEQTSSTSYPNILVLDYMRQTGQITPAIEMKAKQYVNLGYQRLFNYEVDGGGFEAFGNAPANRILTSYGLEQFTDMAKVHPVDPALIPRTRNWLAAQQNEDGSWDADNNYVHAEMWDAIQKSKVLPTAYCAHGLSYSGYEGPALDKALTYLKEHNSEAADAYSLSVMARALVEIDPKDAFTVETLNRLRDLFKETKDEAWVESEGTFSFAHGDMANVEVTAAAAIAFMKADAHKDIVNKILTYLIHKKDPHGTWSSTHATTLALKAFILALEHSTEEAEGKIVCTVNGESAEPVTVTKQNSDVLKYIDLTEFAKEGKNDLRLELEGEGSLMYQVVARYYMPWGRDGEWFTRLGTVDIDSGGLVPPGPAPEILTIDVDYDRTKLAKDDTVLCTVTARNTHASAANMVILDVGVPPGFKVLNDELDALVEENRIEKYTATGRQVTLYLDKLMGNASEQYQFRMQARFPIVAKTKRSSVYEYYNPEIVGYAEPEDIVVTE